MFALVLFFLPGAYLRVINVEAHAAQCPMANTIILVRIIIELQQPVTTIQKKALLCGRVCSRFVWFSPVSWGVMEDLLSVIYTAREVLGIKQDGCKIN